MKDNSTLLHSFFIIISDDTLSMILLHVILLILKNFRQIEALTGRNGGRRFARIQPENCLLQRPRQI